MHDHAHGECCHAPAKYNAAFAVGAIANTTFVIVEVAYGLASHSLSLLADAGHNLGDVLGLLMGWMAAVLATRPPTTTHTYGYRRSSILAAFGNSCILLVGVVVIVGEAIRRIVHPVETAGLTVMIVAAIGIAINGGTALMFVRGRKGELNVRSAYIHMLTDAVVAAGVVVAGFLMKVLGSPLIDPIVSLVIAALIARASWNVLCESIELALDAVPRSVDPREVRKFLEGLPGVAGVSDLHIWAVSTSETILTARIVAPAGLEVGVLDKFEDSIRHEFGIGHSTIQVDREPVAGCSLTA